MSVFGVSIRAAQTQLRDGATLERPWWGLNPSVEAADAIAAARAELGELAVALRWGAYATHLAGALQVLVNPSDRVGDADARHHTGVV